MTTRQITIGKFARESEIPRYSDGRCALSVPVIKTGTQQEIELASKLRRRYLHNRASEIYEVLTSLSVSQMDIVFEKYHAADLGELVYGFVHSGELYLLQLNDAREIIDEVVRAQNFHFKLDPLSLLKDN